jgi:nicotinamide riboside transporter PnuC
MLNPNAIKASSRNEGDMTPPISMIVAAILGVALGYSGRRWWLSGTVTGTLLTIYGMSGSSEGVMLVGVMVVLFFPLFFSIGGLASMIGRFFRRWNISRSRIEPRNP